MRAPLGLRILRTEWNPSAPNERRRHQRSAQAAHQGINRARFNSGAPRVSEARGGSTKNWTGIACRGGGCRGRDEPCRCNFLQRGVRAGGQVGPTGIGGGYTPGGWRKQFVFDRNTLQIAIFWYFTVLPPYPLPKTYDRWVRREG
jgi:hypothetical protein